MEGNPVLKKAIQAHMIHFVCIKFSAHPDLFLGSVALTLDEQGARELQVSSPDERPSFPQHAAILPHRLSARKGVLKKNLKKKFHVLWEPNQGEYTRQSPSILPPLKV